MVGIVLGYAKVGIDATMVGIMLGMQLKGENSVEYAAMGRCYVRYAAMVGILLVE